MSQSLFFTAIYLLGLSFMTGFGPSRSPVLCAAFAFPLGVVATVLGGLVVLALGVDYSLPSILSIGGVLLAVGGFFSWNRHKGEGVEWRVLAACSTVFVLVAVGISSFNVASLSFDSHRMVMLGKGIGYAGGADARTWAEFSEWSAFLVLLHSFAEFLPVQYVYSLAPMLATSFAVFFGVSVFKSLRLLKCPETSSLVCSILISAVLLSTYMFSYHLFYIHTNLISTVFLFGFVSLWWLAETTGNGRLVPPAVVSLLGFSLVRTEAPIIAAIFLSLTAMSSKLSRKTVIGWLSVWAGCLCAWYLLLLGRVPSDSEFLSPGRLLVLLAGVLLTFGACAACGWSQVRRFIRFVPLAVLLAAALGLLGTFFLKPAHMQTSGWNLIKNLTDLRYWSAFWYVSALLAVAAFAVPRVPNTKVMSYGIPTYMAVILMLGYLRIPYRFSFTDSANRMMLHIVPLILLYWTLKFVPPAFIPSSLREGASPQKNTV